MIEKLRPLCRSRRFWSAVAGLAVAITDGLGLELSPETVNQVIFLLAAWIIGDSLQKTE